MIPKTRENLTFEKFKKEEEKVESLRGSLKKLLLDLKNGKELDKIIKELDLSIKYKRDYKSKYGISLSEWCEVNGYIAGFGSYSKDGKNYPAYEIESKFYR
jgi:hypothetical protein